MKYLLLENILKKGAKELGFNLTFKQLQLFQDYNELLLFWNKAINLTTIVDEEEVAQKHFVDSLAYIKAFPPFFAELKFLDIGSGAGFPGVPLKIVFPDLKICLMEPSFKRTSFLHTLNSRLKLDVRIIEEKAEKWLKQNQEYFDVMMMRAVGQIDHFIDQIFDYLNPNGRIIISTGPGERLFNNKKGRDVETISFLLPLTTIRRNLLIIHKS
ncbi:MAG: 16S rRNA (guanine(527)-N(7))-methyltransferase RsmG [Nitrospirae bacterium]|nr:16S rRNA (guanine(527)-N(7))-methyltransferase RsmG [Nitrospirota bacterium]MBI3351961.1 16S rRNA (guanine(527)-N(7))-methyltransferase RsmG [Nitrospirota bacterium]